MKNSIKTTMKIMFVLALMVMAIVPVQAASSDIEFISEGDITSEAYTKINFEDAQLQPGFQYWNTKGVKFDGGEKSTIVRIDSHNRGDVATSSGEYSIANNANYPHTSASIPLSVTFKEGVSKIGFYVGNGNSYGQAAVGHVNLYDVNGNKINGFPFSNIPDAVTKFVGFEVVETPVYRIEIDFGGSVLSEEIDDLMFVKWEEETFTCTDNDGQNLFTKNWAEGWNSLNNKVVSWGDHCAQTTLGPQTETGQYIYESICKNGEVDYLPIQKCPAGYMCSDGACVDDPNAPIVVPTPEPETKDYLIWTRASDKSAQGNVAKYVLKNGVWKFDGVKVSQLRDAIIVSPTTSKKGQSYGAEMTLEEGEPTIFLSFYLERGEELPETLSNPYQFEKTAANGKALIAKKVNGKLTVCSYLEGCSKTYGNHAQELLHNKNGKLWTVYDTQPESVAPVEQCSKVLVDSCVTVLEGIRITRDGNTYTLTNECRDAGHGYRDYTLTCLSATSYQACHTQCKIQDIPIVPVEEPVPVPIAEPTPVPTISEEECVGCELEENCLLTGTRIKQEGQPAMYCDFNGDMLQQKSVGASCQNDYECTTNSCLSGNCVDLEQQFKETQSLLQTILNWLQNLFG